MSKIDGGLRSLFRQHLPQFDWQSIESGLTGAGIPDSNYCREGREGWIEYKRTTGWTVPLEPEQVGWIARRARYGGRVLVAVRQLAPAGPRTAARDSLWVVGAAHVKEAKADGLRALWAPPALAGGTLQVWHGGPVAWNWRAIAARLVA